ncbi:MAG: translational GTPase TypA, partial [Syntrophothermus sp.]
KIITREIDGIKCEPLELQKVQVPEEFAGKVIELVSRRRGDLTHMENKRDRVILEFDIPARGLIGLRNPVLTATEGEAVMAHRFKSFEPWKGDIPGRNNGSLIALETGEAITYSIDKLQDRGKFFIDPGDEVYAGMVIGENTRTDDIIINVIKTKKLSNVRASGSDDKAVIVPSIKFSLEEAMEYIKDDEYVEVTPKSIRLRKIILDETERKRRKKTETGS